MNNENDIDVVEKPIIFFDGFCVLCNGFISFVFNRDKKRVFNFAPLQGKSARERLPPKCVDNYKSVVYFANQRCEMRSSAVIEILLRMGGIYKLAIVLKLFPRRLRDFVYDWIAKHRYRWFGRREQCRLPQPEDKGRMLD